ncbi:hypothetical protein [Pelagibaculum spongiae]|uniref:Uncharacterized protein n=1 Tax=Pelagibaculum spongiae TaxID=2080658 RepID=A0A2V1GPA7_9GAMM|nr:hypothetical protein [Pelagibaculum spongiae]PVZ64357.1 hypothetical protein DC094_20065 [Pelagibaculum spongiae]
MAKNKVIAGRVLGKVHYIHRSALTCLTADQQQAISQAEQLVKENDQVPAEWVENWNLAKVATDLSQVSLLVYQDFKQHLFPCLQHAMIVSLSQPPIKPLKLIDYSQRENPPVLHRQELMLMPDDPRRAQLAEVTHFCESNGLFEQASYIGTWKKWLERLQNRGYQIKKFTIEKIPE